MDVSLSLNGLGAKPLVPIADLEGNAKYSPEEIDCRNKLATLYRLVDLFHWSQAIYNHITVRIPGDKHEILINPLGMVYREMTASSLVKISLDGRVMDPGSTPLGINQAGYILHTAVHEDRRLLVLATTSNEHLLHDADLLSAFSKVIHVERLTHPKHVAAMLEDSNVFGQEEIQYIQDKLQSEGCKIAVGIKRMLELVDFVKQGERDFQVNLLLDGFERMELGI